MTSIGKRKFINENVYEKALERIRFYFDYFDHVAVSFSGGKDSTVVLNLALQVAKERNQLPLHVVFFDEEAISKETVDYVRRVSQMPEIDLKWYCVELKMRNACSDSEPYWYAWEKGKEDLWCRELPPEAITEVPGFNKVQHIEANPYIFPQSEYGNVGLMLGIRAQESMTRTRVVSIREKFNDMARSPVAPWVTHCHPVYDWLIDDVWTAPKKFGWDYNRYYDILNMCGVAPGSQRVCPPFGEEPLQSLYKYALTSPELWEKMSRRVEGANTAALYSRTMLYGKGKNEAVTKDDKETWLEAVQKAVFMQPKETQSKTLKSVRACLDTMYKHTKTPDEKDWKELLKVAKRGDAKGRLAISFITHISYKYGGRKFAKKKG